MVLKHLPAETQALGCHATIVSNSDSTNAASLFPTPQMTSGAMAIFAVFTSPD